MRLDWNLERYRTRDRLLEYDFNIYPAVPHSAGLSMVYPWENVVINQLSKQFIELVHSHGFTGDEQELWDRFSDGVIKHGTLSTFPIPGNKNNLYFDIETEILYYFKAIPHEVLPDDAAVIGAAIVGISRIAEKEQTFTYLYIPIKSLPIEGIL